MFNSPFSWFYSKNDRNLKFILTEPGTIVLQEDKDKNMSKQYKHVLIMIVVGQSLEAVMGEQEADYDRIRNHFARYEVKPNSADSEDSFQHILKYL